MESRARRFQRRWELLPVRAADTAARASPLDWATLCGH
jgi:hypothetical protein